MILMGYGPDAGIMVKQARELGISAVAIGHEEYSPGTGFLESAGPAVEGVIFGASAFNPRDTSDAAQKFTKAYMQAYNKNAPMLYAADLYDNLYVLAKAATDGSCLTDTGMNVDCLRTSIIKVSGFKGLTGPMTFLSNGDISKPINVYRWNKDGTVSLVKSVPP
jgi:branched-chain amino acid transport system substrate-binding protein